MNRSNNSRYVNSSYDNEDFVESTEETTLIVTNSKQALNDLQIYNLPNPFADSYVNSPKYNVKTNGSGRYADINLNMIKKDISTNNLFIEVGESHLDLLREKLRKKVMFSAVSPKSVSPKNTKITEEIDKVINKEKKSKINFGALFRRFTKIFRSNYKTVNHNSSHLQDSLNSPVGIASTPKT